MKIENLVIYPIKSCGSISVDEMSLQEAGPAVIAHGFSVGDREWLLVDSSGKFLTQRELPKLATVSFEVNPRGLKVLLPNVGEVLLPAQPTGEQRIQATVWKSEVDSRLESESAHEAFSEFLERPVRIVRYDERSQRESSPVGSGVQVRFSDSQQLLVVNLKSLADLNSKLESKISWDRFRPNIVMEAETAWEEDSWNSLEVSGLPLESVKPCGRCVIITIDPKTGISPSREPLKVLSGFRKIGNSVNFGQYFRAREKGVIKVGDWVHAHKIG